MVLDSPRETKTSEVIGESSDLIMCVRVVMESIRHNYRFTTRNFLHLFASIL